MTDGTNANFLQVLLRQAAEDPFVNLILSECRLVSSEAQASQPRSKVHTKRAPERLTRIIALVGCTV